MDQENSSRHLALVSATRRFCCERYAYTCATIGVSTIPLGGPWPFVDLVFVGEPVTSSCRVCAAGTGGSDTSKIEQAETPQRLWRALSLAFFRSISSVATSKMDNHTAAKLDALARHVGREDDGGLSCAREATDDRFESQTQVRAERPIHV